MSGTPQSQEEARSREFIPPLTAMTPGEREQIDDILRCEGNIAAASRLRQCQGKHPHCRNTLTATFRRWSRALRVAIGEILDEQGGARRGQ